MTGFDTIVPAVSMAAAGFCAGLGFAGIVYRHAASEIVLYFALSACNALFAISVYVRNT